MTTPELIRQVRVDLARIEELLAQGDLIRTLDAVDALRAGVQAIHLDVWHKYHTSGKGPNNAA